MSTRRWTTGLAVLALLAPPISLSAVAPAGKMVAPAGDVHHRRHHQHKRHHRRRVRPRRHRNVVLRLDQTGTAIHPAGDPADTISDFQFTPATLTVHEGDTVTWTNNGPSAHTATSTSGAFDTGTLQKGQSGSHTFTQSGTFAYICSIHPFMKGTIVVLASSTSSGSSGSGSSSGGSGGSSGSPGSGSSSGSPSTSASTSSGSSSGSGGSLPFTGYELGLIALLGVSLAAAGLAVRQRIGSETVRAQTKNTKTA